jgi:acetyl-CoA carboxylase biotin carboxyl carrier protein
MARARRPAGPPAESGAAVDLARQLGAVLRELDLTEIEASVGEIRVRLQRSVAPVLPLAMAAPVAAAAPATPVSALGEVGSPDLIRVEAPMVGTFYRASSPAAEPYVKEGDVVKEGQILCIIEAMKLMNEIETRRSGRIAKILVENGQPVEYGQPLFLIDPAG